MSGDPLTKIHYSDICSLYPYVNKYGIYPIGHPEIISDNFKSISKSDRPYLGIMKLKILPPPNLLHPLLPMRSNGKLLFPLCKCCAQNEQTEPCQHTVAERALTGTWTTMEIYKALELDYQVHINTLM